MPAAHHLALARDANSTPPHAESRSGAGPAADRRLLPAPPPRALSAPTPPQDPPPPSRALEIPMAPAAPERLDWAEIECAVYAYALSAAPAAAVARRALGVIEEALERYGWVESGKVPSLSQPTLRTQKKVLTRTLRRAFRKTKKILLRVDGGLCLSFNGGKDSTAVLHLAAAAWSRYCSLHGRPRPGAGELPSQPPSVSPASPPQHDRSPAARRLQIFYQTHDDAFDEEEEFVRHAVDVYSLDMVKIDGLTVRAALQQFLDNNPAVRAVLVGTRRTDPHGGRNDRTVLFRGYLRRAKVWCGRATLTLAVLPSL
ncbi:MAG: hypothetical protein BJ554DRAFT_616 [Olpidium bornovanus]|uniref:FAD synthetase n=1 Tax=Olpidium bornovanus TaxID=278681 RepID=A0A8H7ZTP7_9FUNG|nr:MAG: hypothetical protein BJ554DRAFT_616 [Olpidium bornovanus]